MGNLPFMNLSKIFKRKIFIVAFFLLLIATLPLTLFLTRSTQDLRQRASEPTQELKNISGIVYMDQNRNKMFDPDEKPYSNATLYLKSGQTNSILQTVTSSTNGDYLFTDKVAENIYIEIATSDAYTVTTDNIVNIEANSNTDIFSYSYGVYVKGHATIRDKADVNKNGQIDRGDIAEMITCIKKPSECPNIMDFDLNSNGVVNIEDLNTVQREYARNISESDATE